MLITADFHLGKTKCTKSSNIINSELDFKDLCFKHKYFKKG